MLSGPFVLARVQAEAAWKLAVAQLGWILLNQSQPAQVGVPWAAQRWKRVKGRRFGDGEGEFWGRDGKMGEHSVSGGVGIGGGSPYSMLMYTYSMYSWLVQHFTKV